MWEFCGNVQCPHRPKLYGNCAFWQNFHTMKLGEITVFYAVPLFKYDYYLIAYWIRLLRELTLKFIIYSFVMLIFLFDITRCDISMTSSILKTFMKFWGTFLNPGYFLVFSSAVLFIRVISNHWKVGMKPLGMKHLFLKCVYLLKFSYRAYSWLLLRLSPVSTSTRIWLLTYVIREEIKY